MDFVQELRQFNRFYTRHIGLLEEHLPSSGLSLPEGRVLYELAIGGEQAAADLARSLGMDKAHLSRVIERLSRRDLLTSEADPAHRRRKVLSLTAKGQTAFAELDRGTRQQIESMLGPLRDDQRRRLVSAMHEIKTALTRSEPASAEVSLRPLAPGDLGWIIHRQAVLYAQEYGWDWTYEALISKILGEFAADFDPAREDGWVAEKGGQVIGSIFLMRSDDPKVAKLRLLYVEPGARGLGVGKRLVGACIARARELHYARLTLWTNDILTAARRIYIAAGFRLTAEAPHKSFGQDLVGQTWDLEL